MDSANTNPLTNTNNAAFPRTPKASQQAGLKNLKALKREAKIEFQNVVIEVGFSLVMGALFLAFFF